jgi:arylsulfatase A-like enzyme
MRTGHRFSWFGALAFCAANAGIVAAPATPSAPNLLLIVADDLGYADLGVQGCKDVATPSLDALARSGVRFTDGYVTSPVCSPSRAGLITGRYQQRFGHEFNSGPAQRAPASFGLPAAERTVADRLRVAGYRTGAIGKWHLGYRPELWPLQRGFDQFFGFIGGAHSYVQAGRDGANPILENITPVERVAYLTDEFAAQAQKFIAVETTRPWFLYLAFNAVHTPMHATDARLKAVEKIVDPQRRTLAAMLVALDDAVGRVLQTLRDTKQEERTLVVFISDNGGPTAVNSSSNRPLRGFKGEVWEGGLRVPWLMRWPGKVSAGQVVSDPVIALDLVPTLVAAAGLSPSDELDGADLLPRITRRAALPERALCWRFGEQRAVRVGEWKLVDFGDGPRLFNLRSDLAEQRDCAKEHPEKLAELERAYRDWNARNIAPAWPSPPKGSD